MVWNWLLKFHHVKREASTHHQVPGLKDNVWLKRRLSTSLPSMPLKGILNTMVNILKRGTLCKNNVRKFVCNLFPHISPSSLILGASIMSVHSNAPDRLLKHTSGHYTSSFWFGRIAIWPESVFLFILKI